MIALAAIVAVTSVIFLVALKQPSRRAPLLTPSSSNTNPTTNSGTTNPTTGTTTAKQQRRCTGGSRSF